MRDCERIYALIIDNELVRVSSGDYVDCLFDEAWNEIAKDPRRKEQYMHDYGYETEEEAYDGFLEDCGCDDFGIEIRIFERGKGEYEFSRLF